MKDADATGRGTAPVSCTPPQRRPLLAACAAVLAAPWWAGVRAATPAELAAAVEPVEVEAGVYMLPGLAGLAGPDNLGRIGNAGFIVGRSGVMAVDTGTSHLHGLAVLAAIARVTPLPVRLVLLTHAQREFLFGASAFQARGIPVHMHRSAAALMAARCANCLKALRTEVGEASMQGSVLPKPDAVFDDTHVVETIGRPVLVQHHGHASSPGDSSAFDVRSGTFFAGGLLENRRIPDIQDSDVDGWRQALSSLRSLQINTVVPGHGPAGDPALIRSNHGYLVELERRCAALLKDGAALSDVPDAAALPAFSRWDQYDTVHRRNASIMFLRLERQLLQDEPQRQGPPR